MGELRKGVTSEWEPDLIRGLDLGVIWGGCLAVVHSLRPDSFGDSVKICGWNGSI